MLGSYADHETARRLREQGCIVPVHSMEREVRERDYTRLGRLKKRFQPKRPLDHRQTRRDKMPPTHL